jgi:hypothetical protein
MAPGENDCFSLRISKENFSSKRTTILLASNILVKSMKSHLEEMASCQQN